MKTYILKTWIVTGENANCHSLKTFKSESSANGCATWMKSLYHSVTITESFCECMMVCDTVYIPDNIRD